MKEMTFLPNGLCSGGGVEITDDRCSVVGFELSPDDKISFSIRHAPTWSCGDMPMEVYAVLQKEGSPVLLTETNNVIMLENLRGYYVVATNANPFPSKAILSFNGAS